MRLLVDENIPRQTVRALREFGHDVRDVRGTGLEGADDRVLWQLAQREERLLITTDRDFAARRTEPHFGILIVRLRQPKRARIHQRLMHGILGFSPEAWRRLLVILRDRAVSMWEAPEREA